MVNHFMCVPCIPKGLPFFMLFNIALLILEREEISPASVFGQSNLKFL